MKKNLIRKVDLVNIRNNDSYDITSRIDDLFNRFRDCLSLSSTKYSDLEFLGKVAETRKIERLFLCRKKSNKEDLFILKKFNLEEGSKERDSFLFEAATPILVDSPWLLKPDEFLSCDHQKVNFFFKIIV